MRDINEVLEDYSEDMISVSSWCQELYDNMFKAHFDVVDELYNRFNSESHIITDEELNSILIDLPIELFAASEGLNSLRRDLEVIKLKNRDMKNKIKSEIAEEADKIGHKLTQTELADILSGRMAEYEIPVLAFNSLITRVENQMSFSRELIMGAKKIFDSRRAGEKTMPVSEIDQPNNIPDYVPTNMKNKSYIQ